MQPQVTILVPPHPRQAITCFSLAHDETLTTLQNRTLVIENTKQ